MKRNSLKVLSMILMSCMIMSSCSSSKRRDIKVRNKQAPDPTEETVVDETTDETFEPQSPEVTTIPADAPVAVDWDNYQAAEKKQDIYTRISDDPITDFVPSDEYGMIYPFLASRSNSAYVDEYETGISYHGFESYGLCDKEGRIVCDPVFSNASVINDSIILVYKNDGEKDKYGLISIDGSKYTGLIYDHIYYLNGENMCALANGRISVIDPDLNVLTDKPFNIDLYNSDDLKEMAEEYGIELEKENISIMRFYDESHFLFYYLGETFLADLDTGNMVRCYGACYGGDVIVLGDYGAFYLADINGNPISDDYETMLYSADFPIFEDANGNYVGMDRQGNVVYEFGTSDSIYSYSYDECFIVFDDDDCLVFDMDFNLIKEYGHAKYLFSYEWTGKYWDTNKEPYLLLDDGDIINAFTGETVYEDAKEDVERIYVSDDLIVCQDNYAVYVSNGDEYSGMIYDFEVSVDIQTGKVFIAEYNDDNKTMTLHDLTDDKEIDIYTVPYIYRMNICDGKCIMYGEDVTLGFDINGDEPQVIFRYYCIDPLVDD